MTAATPGPHSCGCPETDGKVYHQRGTCADPVVARLDWYADGDRTASPDAFDTPDGRTYSGATAATPGQAACEAAGETWADQGPERRGKWEAVAEAARDHRGELPPSFPPEEAYSPEETAYEAFTARRGPQRIAWEALSAEERADWRAVVRALAKRSAR